MTPPATGARASQVRLEVLLAEYASVREDERTFSATQATLVAVAVSLLGLGAGLLTQVCTFAAHNVVVPGKAAAAGCTIVPDPLLAASPLAVLALLAYITAHGSLAASRSFYVRAIEREIRALLGPGERGFDAFRGLSLMSSAELSTAEMSLSGGSRCTRPGRW